MASLRIPPPLQGLFWGFCMWGLAKMFSGLQFSFYRQSYLSYLIIGIGLAIEITAVLAFFKARTTVNPVHIEKASQLVTGGLYQFSRNPMYLGVSILLTGWFTTGRPVASAKGDALAQSITLYSPVSHISGHANNHCSKETPSQ